jgi:glutathione reductase (NADPH)
MATVGVTEEEARAEHGDDIEIYKSRFTPMKLTMFKPLDVQPKTLMKIVVQKSNDKVLGVHMCGPDAAEIIQGMAIALKAGCTKSDFDVTIGIHPSAAEEFVTMRTPVAPAKL